MIDPKNIINITGGVVADPELVNDGKIANFTLAVDYAGSEKGSDNNTGYFDIVYYLKDGSAFASKNASFIHNQISESKIKKGARLSIVGRVVQQRWKQDDKTRTKIVIIAEHIAYAVTSGAKPANGSTTSSDAKETTSASAASVPDSF
jgi:single-stranded DNA-binding protein